MIAAFRNAILHRARYSQLPCPGVRLTPRAATQLSRAPSRIPAAPYVPNATESYRAQLPVLPAMSVTNGDGFYSAPNLSAGELQGDRTSAPGFAKECAKTISC